MEEWGIAFRLRVIEDLEHEELYSALLRGSKYCGFQLRLRFLEG